MIFLWGVGVGQDHGRDQVAPGGLARQGMLMEPRPRVALVAFHRPERVFPLLAEDLPQVLHRTGQPRLRPTCQPAPSSGFLKGALWLTPTAGNSRTAGDSSRLNPRLRHREIQAQDIGLRDEPHAVASAVEGGHNGRRGQARVGVIRWPCCRPCALFAPALARAPCPAPACRAWTDACPEA